MFFEPLPFVSRVIFISTPHRGSFLAENWLGMLARRLINTPAAMTHFAGELGSCASSGAARELEARHGDRQHGLVESRRCAPWPRCRSRPA